VLESKEAIQFMLQKIGIAVAIVTAIGLFVGTGSAVPPDNTVVYVDPKVEYFYPPTRTPEGQGYKATAYALAKGMGAKPDDPSGFNVEGPPLLIDLMLSAGLMKSWPRYWYGTDEALEFYSEEAVEQARNAL
jgi:hypothetical protein